MSTAITGAFVAEYSDGVTHVATQRKAKLVPLIRTANTEAKT